MIMEDKSNDIKRQVKKCKSSEEFEELISKLQQLEFKELSNSGKYIGKFVKPPVDFVDPFGIVNDYNSEKDKSDKLSDLDDRSNTYVES